MIVLVLKIKTTPSNNGLQVIDNMHSKIVFIKLNNILVNFHKML